MGEISSYVDYLPPVLWSRESDPELLLGRALRVFEKILTGIDDGIVLEVDGHDYAALEWTIDHLHRLFDPWGTRADMLPWLAHWASLELPSWDEYAQRRLIAEIVPIHQRRGSKGALLAYLNILGTTIGQPRVVIDDGVALFRSYAAADGMLQLVPTTYAATFGTQRVLLHPTAVAASQDGAGSYYIVADQGIPDKTKDFPAAIYRLTGDGRLMLQDGAPKPLHRGEPLVQPIAVAIDARQRCIVADIGAVTSPGARNAAIYRLEPPGYVLTQLITTKTTPPLPAVMPVDLALDSAGHLLLLDRGIHTIGNPPYAKADPRLIVVTITSESPLSVAAPQVIPLPNIVEPTALAVDALGLTIVADARDQKLSLPADLIRIDLESGAQTSLLGALPAAANPLRFPTSLVFESPQVLLVCDSGVRWGTGNLQALRSVADPAAIYRVNLAAQPPVITRLTRDPVLVAPAGLALDPQGLPLIVERGESTPDHEWRGALHEFGVSVLFSQQRTPTLSTQANEQFRREARAIIDAYKPAHSVCWFDV